MDAGLDDGLDDGLAGGLAGGPPTTVAGLQVLMSRREACWEAEIATIDVVLDGAVVFCPLATGGVETYTRERREAVHRRRFASEADAVAAAWRQCYRPEQEPTVPRRPATTTPVTVEELHDALAAVGQDPDQLTRAELLAGSPKPDPLLVVRTGEAYVETWTLERGVERDHRRHPDEATVVAAWAARLLLPHVDDEVGDLRVERMAVHARQQRARRDARRGDLGSGPWPPSSSSVR